MRVLVSPDSFKGTFSAQEVAAAVAAGLRAGGVEAEECPVADGGEGTLEVLRGALGGFTNSTTVSGPLGKPVEAVWGWFPDLGFAIIEAAQACGLHLSNLTPRAAFDGSTRGVGQLIRAAVEAGATRVVLTVGGTATTDGGAGLLDEFNAGLPAVSIEVLSDVTVPYGDAARMFGPQKGADSATVELLTDRLDDTAARLAQRFGRDPRGVPGTGAGGGISGALWAAFGAPIRSGAGTVLDLLQFDRRLEGVVAVVAGEGRFDDQSAEGKIVGVIAQRAGRIPVHVVAGQVDLETDRIKAMGVAACWTAKDLTELTETGRAIAAMLHSSGAATHERDLSV